MENFASKAEQRTVVASWSAMFALAVLLMVGGLYLLQRRRANLSTPKILFFRDYEGPKLSFDFASRSTEVFVFNKIHVKSGDDGISQDLESDVKMENIAVRHFGFSKVRDSVNLSFCFTFAEKVNEGIKIASLGTEYQDIFKCRKLLPSINNIFFLETSCADSKRTHPSGMKLTPKQACTIYSAAHHNPSRKVVLLFTCPLAPGFHTLTGSWMNILLNLPNLYFGQINLEDLYANTSLLELYREVLSYSEYSTVHQADILRLFVLYVYGGTYLDLDTITLRSLDDLGFNFIGFESDDSVNNAVMNFETKHRFLELGFAKAMLSYEPNKWTTIGPNMITKMIRKCNISQKFDGNSILHVPSCNITVLPAKTFYAVEGRDWSYFYNETQWPEFEEMLNESYVTHYWNHMGSFPLFIGSNQPLMKLAEQHCMGVYNASGQTLW